MYFNGATSSCVWSNVHTTAVQIMPNIVVRLTHSVVYHANTHVATSAVPCTVPYPITSLPRVEGWHYVHTA